MADDFVGFKIAPEQLARVDLECERLGMGRSEWMRIAVAAALEGGPIALDSNDGYAQARALAAKLAHAMLSEAQRLLPESYEEAVARFKLAGPGRKRSPA